MLLQVTEKLLPLRFTAHAWERGRRLSTFQKPMGFGKN